MFLSDPKVDVLQKQYVFLQELLWRTWLLEVFHVASEKAPKLSLCLREKLFVSVEWQLLKCEESFVWISRQDVHHKSAFAVFSIYILSCQMHDFDHRT